MPPLLWTGWLLALPMIICLCQKIYRCVRQDMSRAKQQGFLQLTLKDVCLHHFPLKVPLCSSAYYRSTYNQDCTAILYSRTTFNTMLGGRFQWNVCKRLDEKEEGIKCPCMYHCWMFSGWCWETPFYHKILHSLTYFIFGAFLSLLSLYLVSFSSS